MMCGILAIRSFGAPVTPERLLAGMCALRHRGPDGEAHWIAPHQRVGLAHTRLSIIDLETGAQPITSEDGQVTVIVNGELYGFEAIRAQLEQKGHRFCACSDAEIVVHLYEEHGRECLEHLRGEFAFALWDERRDLLLAARDRFGIKPLFYARTGGALYLASEAKALFAAGVPAAWNQDSVFHSLFACPGPDESLFRDVRQLPPGHLLEATHNAVHVRPYWDAEYPLAERARTPPRHPDEYVEQVRALLDEAVRLRMRADVPVGCLLSGGLDSAAVLGMAARYAQGPMAAFTISFDDPEYDEVEWARQAAEFSGADLAIVSATHECLAQHFEDSVRQGEIMLYNAHGTARFVLSRAVARAGYKTMLAGEGADELFAGYGFCRPAVLARRRTGPVPSSLRFLWRIARPSSASQKSIARTSPWLARASRAVDLPDALLVSLAEGMDVLRSVLSPAFVEQHGRDPYRSLFESLNPVAKLRGREPAKQLIYLWLKTIFPAYVLAADRADMAHGVEVRLPFLDHVLFEHVRSIPVQTLAFGGEIKHLLREAAAPYIAPVTRRRLKKPLMAPPFTMQRGNRLLAVIQDLLRSETARDLPFFDDRGLVAVLDGLSSGDTAREATVDPLLVMAASLCVLQKSYRLGETAARST